MLRLRMLSLLILFLAACATAPASTPVIPAADAAFQTQVAQLRGSPAVPLFTPTPTPVLLRFALEEPDSLFQPFEFFYPDYWRPFSASSSSFTTVIIGNLRLLVFSGSASLNFDETFACFRGAFLQDSASAERRQTPYIEAELIDYTNSQDNCVISYVRQPGVIALWEHNNAGYALIDEAHRQQTNGIFHLVLNSFRFLD